MFEPVIGLEVHFALRTASKLFCGCSAQGFGAGPNEHVCPVCLGLPGTLPALNEEAVELALRFALALGCEVPPQTYFHRKHYFYPDAPKNYQTSQGDVPVGQHGHIDLPSGKRVGITRCHLEEDAGRLVHPPYADHSLVDLNRAGAPLIEMVTEPDLRSADEAREFLTEVRAIAQALGVSDAAPEEGKMRADVNVSVRLAGEPFGTKVEVKNLNSFKSVAAALAFETKRQSGLLEADRPVTQETRGWNEGGQRTYSLRSKETAADYRYLRDPDIPAVALGADRKRRMIAALPELPRQLVARYLAAGVREAEAKQIGYDHELAAFFDAAAQAYGGAPQTVANWVTGEVAGRANDRGQSVAATRLTPAALVALLDLVDAGTLSITAAKELVPELLDGAQPAELVASRGLGQVSDSGALQAIVDEVLAANPDLVERVTANPKAINALLGKVMAASKGKANPDLARRLLGERLG
ncbi:MAG: Asp-tRNA(Asn)/Glu-tRNA(Gln) amidotransferase subunit GatB [Trueperaceae bacterium]